MPNPVRILRVFGHLHIGGAESRMMDIYRIIDRESIQFDFIVHSKRIFFYEDEIHRLGGKIFHFPKFNILTAPYYIYKWYVFLKNHPEYIVVHGHVRSTASIYLSIARKFGLKTIVHSHSTSSGIGIIAFIKDIFQIPLRRFIPIDKKIACSKAAGDWLFGNNSKYLIIKNAIDTKKYSFNSAKRELLRNQLGIQGQYVIGHVGSFSFPKNHLFLIEIFRSIWSMENNSTLILVGDGQYRNEIIIRINQNNISERVILLGERDDVADLMQCMDAFVFPSLYEGLGNVLIEAQASGLKCFASDVIPEETKITDLIHYISLKESPHYWATQILAHSKQYQRRDTQQELFKAGYDVHDLASWYTEFYMSIAHVG